MKWGIVGTIKSWVLDELDDDCNSCLDERTEAPAMDDTYRPCKASLCQ